MKCCVRLLLLTPVVIALVSCTHNPRGDEGRPPLLEQPKESKEPPPSSKGAAADNSWCHVCHINYAEEELAVAHLRANVGCASCHGDSYAHRGDEANVTPPEIMYPKERINPSCLKCHAPEKLSDVHRPVLARTAEEKYCTDCHGEHRLAHRTVRWDKATGKLLRGE